MFWRTHYDGSSRQPSRPLKLRYLMGLALLIVTCALPAAALADPISGVGLNVSNFQGNHPITFFSVTGTTTAACSDETTTTTMSRWIKPGESLSLEVHPGWSGIICVSSSTTAAAADPSTKGATLWANYHANLTVMKDLTLVGQVVMAPCDNNNNNLPKMNPVSDCPRVDCSSSSQYETWACNFDHGDHVIGISASLKLPRGGAKGDGQPVSSGTKLMNPFVLFFSCLVVAARRW